MRCGKIVIVRPPLGNIYVFGINDGRFHLTLIKRQYMGCFRILFRSEGGNSPMQDCKLPYSKPYGRLCLHRSGQSLHPLLQESQDSTSDLHSKGQRYYVPVRGKLKKKTMIQPNVPETEILGECCGHDVDQFICLSYNAKGVVKYAVPKQSVRKGGFCLPAGNGKFCFHPCVGRFFKFIVPDIMVGIVLLYKPVRGLPAENEPSA